MKQAVQMFGPAQFAVAKAVADCVADGVIPKDQVENLVVVCGRFIHGCRRQQEDLRLQLRSYKQAIINAMGKSLRWTKSLARRTLHRILSKVSNRSHGSNVSKPRILIQLDTDPHASVFDGVVAVDAGVEHLFQYSNVKPDDVRALIHGAMFTRGPSDLHSTAVFVGGSDVTIGRSVADAAAKSCFDPFRVSIMHDSNGCNSTAAAAVLCASKHLDFCSRQRWFLPERVPLAKPFVDWSRPAVAEPLSSVGRDRGPRNAFKG